MFFRPAYHLFAYYVSLALFGAGGLALNLFSLLAGGWPATERTERFFQRLIHRHFAVFVWWLGLIRLLRVHYQGFDQLPRGGQVLAANHPGLMDAVYLLARLPEAVCIFKPAIRGNPVLGATPRRAGYLSSDGGHDLVRQAAEKVAAGQTLIIFPEGTRTPPGRTLLPLKPGFVLMARRAGVPIQLVRITWTSNILAKGQTWWKLPRAGRVHVTAGPRLKVEETEEPAVLTARIEAWFHSATTDHAAGAVLPAALPPQVGLPSSP